MNWGIELVLAFVILAGGIFLGIRLPFAIGIGGVALLLIHSGTEGWFSLGLAAFDTMNSFTLSAAPLFIIMASLLLYGGISKDLFDGLSVIFRRVRGSLYYSTIVGCAIFAALAGSSMATTAAVGVVSVPEMDSRGYDRAASLGTLAAGGTLGILIPPSIPMILYGAFTEQDVSRLFMAGMIPGICLSLLYMVMITVLIRLRPALAPVPVKPGTSAYREAVKTLPRTIAIFVVIVGVLGSIYFGIATATEAAAVGVVMSIIVNLFFTRGRVKGIARWIWEGAIESVGVTCFILFIVLGASIFGFAFANAGLSDKLVNFIVALNPSKFVFLGAVYILMLILGCFLEAVSIICLTTPVVFPVIIQLGIDPIWYGVALVVLCELAQLTPPVGVNLFVVQGIAKGAPLELVVRGVFPFILMQVLLLIIITVFPQLALWLPSTMG